MLIVEDEVKMASLIRRGLREEGLAADVAIKGEGRALDGRLDRVDAIVLDVMLPGMTASRPAEALRGDGVWTPSSY